MHFVQSVLKFNKILNGFALGALVVSVFTRHLLLNIIAIMECVRKIDLIKSN